jgi:hypothetical protein
MVGWVCENCGRANCRFRWEVWVSACRSSADGHRLMEAMLVVSQTAGSDRSILRFHLCSSSSRCCAGVIRGRQDRRQLAHNGSSSTPKRSSRNRHGLHPSRSVGAGYHWQTDEAVLERYIMSLMIPMSLPTESLIGTRGKRQVLGNRCSNVVHSTLYVSSR